MPTIPLGVNFVQEDGFVEALLHFAPINDEDPSQDGWLARIEKLRWMSE